MRRIEDCYKCKKYPCYKTEEIQKIAVFKEIRITCNGCEKFIKEIE